MAQSRDLVLLVALDAMLTGTSLWQEQFVGLGWIRSRQPGQSRADTATDRGGQLRIG